MKLFSSAIAKLATWYLIILMAVSLLFSIIIFQVAQSEIASRLSFIVNQPDSFLSSLQAREQLEIATASLVVSLGYINLVVLLAGGAGAYLLAKQTLKPIESAHEAQSRFVSNASHQFRTPLAIMKAEIELALSDKGAKKSELKQTLVSNLEEVNHLSDLSSMLLELSQNKKALSDTPDKINLQILLEDIVDSQGLGERTEIMVSGSPIIFSYETAIKEICRILLDNAQKHGSAGTPIIIDLKEDKGVISISFSNQGGAIEQTQLQKVFERFYRTKQTEGYGLGLPLAKQLVEVLGGTISLTNLPQDKGVIAEVVLPKR
ncbi:hypothetical protein B7Y94_05445 [Candidatus Saccharibacteria bacterium 32-49-12]|nr:MAG: hypothetical protein B7Y94_05445 [Candidatus Saccharibacteria bacterium 32-49-12]